MGLFIYLLTRKGDIAYDETAALVVRARSSVKARKLAAAAHGDEGAITWTCSGRSNCRKLGEATPGARADEAVILRDFKAG